MGEPEAQVHQDLRDDLGVLDEREDPHGSAAARADQRVYLFRESQPGKQRPELLPRNRAILFTPGRGGAGAGPYPTAFPKSRFGRVSVNGGYSVSMANTMRSGIR